MAVAAVLARAGDVRGDDVARMLAAAPHRGPRRETLTAGRCVLGTANPDGRSDASLATADGMAAAFTGVLDNAADVVRELEGRGSAPASSTPAAVVLAGFRHFGEGLPHRLRGIFACVLTDGDRLWCFRDHAGYATLFYRPGPGGLHVATEAKQVVAGAGLPRQPDLEVIERIFYGDLDDDTPTALKGVRHLPKATVLSSAGDGVRLRRYWDPEALLETARYSDDEVAERFHHLFAQAVRRMLSGEDVVSLSGGIDSPPIAAVAAPEHLRLTGRPISALSAVYPDQPSVDESEYIKIVADSLGILLHTYPRKARPLVGLAEWVRRLDGPVPVILHSDVEEHYRHVARLGFRTMLTGEVAEFVFAMRPHTLSHLLLAGRIGAFRRYFSALRARGVSPVQLATQLAAGVAPAPAVAAYARRRGAVGSRAPEWVDAGRVRRVAAQYVAPARRRWAQQQLLGFIGPGLTMEADDVVQALFGVRTRRPWSDIDLWEFFLSLPAEVKYGDPQRKGLVRTLMRGRVPDAILDRRTKTDFEASFMARIDYPALRRWLLDPPYRMPGVDYRRLAERLERENFSVADHHWATDLAATHAFLEPE
jgi:asparagine synthase (glutamine-hydrolysing)